MGIDWKAEVPLKMTRDEAKERIREIITVENYGFEGGQWNLSDLRTMKRKDFQIFAYKHIEGVDQKSGRPDARRTLRDANGMPMMFRFAVLTRQACDRDKDGNPLGLLNKDRYVRSRDLYNKPDDKPQPGDIVRVKGDPELLNDDDTQVDQARVMELHAQGKDIYNWHEYTLDEVCTIRVPYEPANAMLKSHGKRLVFPEFQRPGLGEASKRITNWWFEEVPQDYKKPRKQRSDAGTTRAPVDKPPDETAAAD